MNGIWAARARAPGNVGGNAFPDAAKMKKPRNGSSQKLRIGSSVQIEPYYSMCRRSLGVHKLYLLFWSGCINNLLLANRLHKFGLVCAAHEKSALPASERARESNKYDWNTHYRDKFESDSTFKCNGTATTPPRVWMNAIDVICAQHLSRSARLFTELNNKIRKLIHIIVRIFIYEHISPFTSTQQRTYYYRENTVSNCRFCIFEFELKPTFSVVDILQHFSWSIK